MGLVPISQKDDLTLGDVYKLSLFATTLFEVDMTSAEIKIVPEEALDYTLQPDGSTDACPYAAGLRYHVDVSKPAGERLCKMQLKGRDEITWVPLNGTLLMS